VLALIAANSHALRVNRFLQAEPKMQGARVLILISEYKGQQGVCLGKADEPGRWAVSPDITGEVLSLVFERDFGLLVDLSTDPERN
jgi:hypothetical protein